MSKDGSRKPVPHADRATGRITLETRAEILKQLDSGRSAAEVARQYGVSVVTVYRWRNARDAARSEADPDGQSGLKPRSTRPIDTVSPVTPRQRSLVLEVKQEHPEMGPAQLRNQLRRFHGVSLSHKTIGSILKAAGHKLETRVPDKEEKAVERFEMSRPNELWTIDIKEFFVHDVKLYLFALIDDYSRFVVGHGLYKDSTSERALAVLKDAIGRHGKPERVLSDRGREFHHWGGESSFTKFLEDELIAHSLARPHHPQTCGKVEALFGTVTEELFGRVRFDSISHAGREIAAYFENYNFQRTHMGIGGVTPSDRYFARVDAGIKMIEGQVPPIDRRGQQTSIPGERPIVLQIALESGQLVLWFAGKRVVLG
jgi:transposase InsO family protein